MDHLSNGNLRAPENHFRSTSSEIVVDDIVVEIARPLRHPAINIRIERARNKLQLHKSHFASDNKN